MLNVVWVYQEIVLEIINGLVYINGKLNVLPERAKIQYNHFIYNKKEFHQNHYLILM